MRKLNITVKNLLSALLLIGFVTCCIAFCSRHISAPFLEPQPEFQDDLVFQSTHETIIKENIELLLNRLIGKKTFVVSVMSNLKEHDVVAFSKEHHPRIVTLNSELNTLLEDDSMSSFLEEDGVTYLKNRASTSAIKRSVEDHVLPGLNSELSLFAPVLELPGFPTFDHAAYSEESLDDDSFEAGQQGSDSSTNEANSTSERSESSEHLIFDESTTESVSPRTVIDHIVVSVVIDEDYFNYLDISRDVLRGLIGDVAGIQPQRGDQLVVSYVPFLEKGFSWKHFIKKNRWLFERFNVFIEKSKPVLFGVFFSVIIGALCFAGFKWIVWYRKKQLDAELEAKRLAEEESKKNKEMKINQIEEKRQALLQLAQTKPDQFVSLLNSWIEIDEHESTKV